MIIVYLFIFKCSTRLITICMNKYYIFSADNIARFLFLKPIIWRSGYRSVNKTMSAVTARDIWLCSTSRIVAKHLLTISQNTR